MEKHTQIFRFFRMGALLIFCTLGIQAHGQIINLYAGISASGFSGDGAAATLAQFNDPDGIAADNNGNVYISDVNNGRIRKVDASGIITTYAGTGTPTYTGDGGPATAATFGDVEFLGADPAGNLYLPDFTYKVLRKINTSGIITTYAGTGTSGSTGDGGPATAAEFAYMAGLPQTLPAMCSYLIRLTTGYAKLMRPARSQIMRAAGRLDSAGMAAPLLQPS